MTNPSRTFPTTYHFDQHRFAPFWRLDETEFTRHRGRVFSTFSGGGGSSMGYKLAGFDVTAICEIDDKMVDAYVTNLGEPDTVYNQSIVDVIDDHIPDELFDIDILDGSPPCTLFSIARTHKRDDWTVARKYREGMAEQRLDDLFFHFIALAKRIRPRVCIAENVPGMLHKDGKPYVRKIYKQFRDIGYHCQHFVLNAKHMGVPQSRKRLFFIALRDDLAGPYMHRVDLFTHQPKIDMTFNEPVIPFDACVDHIGPFKPLTGERARLYAKCEPSDRGLEEPAIREGHRKMWHHVIAHRNRPCPTITGNSSQTLIFEGRDVTDMEIKRAQTFPDDYIVDGDVGYVCGMSVPPVMIANIASRVFDTWSDVFEKHF